MSRIERQYPQITKAVYERPWAIQPAMLAVIEEIVRLRAIGSPLTEEEIEARVSAAQNGPRNGAQRAQGVAVVPLYGVITQRANLMSAMSGGTSVEQLTRNLSEAIADPDIGAIVLDVDSPGGSVEGVTEAAATLRAMRGRKPIVAVANQQMASAAYWIASQADEVIASPSAQVGSIGVFGTHVDQSKADEQAGEKYTIVSAGKGKTSTNPHLPLTDDGLAELQALADDYYSLFVSDVTAGRGVTAEKVTDEWQAKLFSAKRALAGGLVDRIETLDATVRRLVVQANQTSLAAQHALASAGLTASEQIAVLMTSLSAEERSAVLAQHGTDAPSADADDTPRDERDETGEPAEAQASPRLSGGPEEVDADATDPDEARRRLAAARARAALAVAHVRNPSDEEVAHV